MSPINQVPVLGSGIRFAALGLFGFIFIGIIGLKGCGGGGEQTAAQQAASESESGATEQVVAEATPPPAGTVQIAGVIKYEGDRPPRSIVKMDADAFCAKAHGGQPVGSEDALISDEGQLANVLVYIKKGLEGKKFPVPTSPAVLDQQGCVYVPHVLAMMAGQQLDIVSSDTTLHNVHCMGKDNPEFNFGMPGPGRRDRVFRKPEIGVKFKCDVHPWMGAWVHVLDHPCFSVSDRAGAWSINGLPPGEYTLGAWHEKFGEQEQKITVTDAGATDLTFTFKAAEKK